MPFKRRNRAAPVTFILLAVAGAFAGGCCARERHLIWSNVVAVEGERGTFRSVTFDLPAAATSPGFSIRLPDGGVLKSAELATGWGGEKVLTYDTGFVLIAQRDGAVRRVVVEIPHWKKAELIEPAIGDASGSVFYQLPISRRDLVRLFGPPERVDIYTRGLILRTFPFPSLNNNP